MRPKQFELYEKMSKFNTPLQKLIQSGHYPKMDKNYTIKTDTYCPNAIQLPPGCLSPNSQIQFDQMGRKTYHTPECSPYCSEPAIIGTKISEAGGESFNLSLEEWKAIAEKATITDTPPPVYSAEIKSMIDAAKKDSQEAKKQG